MKKSFLDYYKEILEKVSFDPHLLYKEYQKAIKTLNHSEVHQLNSWVKEKGLQTSFVRSKSNKTSLFSKLE